MLLASASIFLECVSTAHSFLAHVLEVLQNPLPPIPSPAEMINFVPLEIESTKYQIELSTLFRISC